MTALSAIGSDAMFSGWISSIIFLSIAGLMIVRWARTKSHWSEARRTTRHVRSAFAIATCLFETLFVILDTAGLIGLDWSNGARLALANIGGLLLLMTACSVIVELVIVVRRRENEVPSRLPARPDLRRTE